MPAMIVELTRYNLSRDTNTRLTFEKLKFEPSEKSYYLDLEPNISIVQGVEAWKFIHAESVAQFRFARANSELSEIVLHLPQPSGKSIKNFSLNTLEHRLENNDRRKKRVTRFAGTDPIRDESDKGVEGIPDDSITRTLTARQLVRK